MSGANSSLTRKRDSAQSEDTALQSSDVRLLGRFIGGVVTREYDGSENEALAAIASLLGPERSGQFFSALVSQNMRLFPCACVDLLKRLINASGEKATAEWTVALRDLSAAIVEALPKLEHTKPVYPDSDWQRARKMSPVDPMLPADLLDSFLRKYSDFFFNYWPNTELNHATRGFGVETTTQRVQEIVQHLEEGSILHDLKIGEMNQFFNLADETAVFFQPTAGRPVLSDTG